MKNLLRNASLIDIAKLKKTLERFRVDEPSKEVMSETILRLNSMVKNGRRFTPTDPQASKLFEMLDYFRSDEVKFPHQKRRWRRNL